MQIVIASMFHNSVVKNQLPGYVAQVQDLTAELKAAGHTVRYVFVYGDCTDATGLALAQSFPGATLIERSHGQVFASVDHVERWRRIAYVANAALDALTDADDVLIWVESDLLWQSGAIMKLLSHLGPTIDGCAAMCGYLPEGGRFYDTWGHRKNGIPFGMHPPYHPDIGVPHGLTEIDSAGSCWVVKAPYARAGHYDDTGIVGWCKWMRIIARAKLWLDLDVWVWHP